MPGYLFAYSHEVYRPHVELRQVQAKGIDIVFSKPYNKARKNIPLL